MIFRYSLSLTEKHQANWIRYADQISISRSNIWSENRINISRSDIRSPGRISIFKWNMRSAGRIRILRSNIRTADRITIVRCNIQAANRISVYIVCKGIPAHPLLRLPVDPACPLFKIFVSFPLFSIPPLFKVFQTVLPTLTQTTPLPR